MKPGARAYPTVIDCDPGVDDALALALALASPELDLRAITTVHGNVPARQAFRNARRVLSFLGMHGGGADSLPPVYPGAGRPLRGGRIDRRVSCAIHGPGGLGDLFKNRPPPSRLPPAGHIPADRVLAGLARQLKGALRIIAVGPLTNLARAVRLDREALAGVGRIVVMGGAAQMPGNATPAAEFNIHCDPEAAAVVMGCGAPITMVGLDVTRRALLPSSSLKGGGPFRRALRDLVRPYAAFSRKHRGVDGVVLHDPLAVAAAIDPGLLGCRSREVAVECGKGPARGMTVVDLRAGSPPPRPGGVRGVEVALEVDEKRFLRFFLGRLRKFRGWS